MLKNILCTFLFFVAFFLSLFVKVINTDIDQDSFLEDNTTLPIEYLLQGGFSKINQHLLLNNEFMVTSLMRHRSCHQGKIYITPLFRNSEGVTVLQEKIVTEGDDFYFLYQGKIYDSFPSLRFWAGMNIEKMGNIFDDKETPLEAHYVLAVVERGPCNLKNTLNWQEI